MARIQPRQVTADVVTQTNLEDLFELAHDHVTRTTVPTEREGVVGDIVLYDNTLGVTKLYVKFPSGWRSVALT
jgi:hypothetical protein